MKDQHDALDRLQSRADEVRARAEIDGKTEPSVYTVAHAEDADVRLRQARARRLKKLGKDAGSMSTEDLVNSLVNASQHAAPGGKAADPEKPSSAEPFDALSELFANNKSGDGGDVGEPTDLADAPAALVSPDIKTETETTRTTIINDSELSSLLKEIHGTNS